MTAAQVRRVLVVGSVTHDTNVIDGVTHRALGGTVLYAAHAYAALGIDCRVVTAVADRDRAAVAAAFATTELVLQRSDATTTFENQYLTDGARRQRASTLARPLRHEAEWLAGIDLVHLGPLHPHDLEAAWFDVASAPLALDLQGLTRRLEAGRVLEDTDPRLCAWLPRFRWLKGSEREWSLVREGCGASTCYAPDAERLITRGIAGGEVETIQRRHVWDAAPPISGCDPTGAGDVYFAAYLAARAEGVDAVRASDRAAAFTSTFLAGRSRWRGYLGPSGGVSAR